MKFYEVRFERKQPGKKFQSQAKNGGNKLADKVFSILCFSSRSPDLHNSKFGTTIAVNTNKRETF